MFVFSKLKNTTIMNILQRTRGSSIQDGTLLHSKKSIHYS
jgi:hypothetical protein